MSDRSALAERQETADREQETLDALTPAFSQGEREEVVQEVAENAVGLEQKATEETKGDVIEETVVPELETENPDTLTPALSQRERELTAERIRQSEALPAGLRGRLAELVLASDGAAAETAIRAVEASLPFAVRIGPSEIARPAHPAGDVFFHGDADAVSEEAAEAIARGQLARSGMLRGQRARVAE